MLLASALLDPRVVARYRAKVVEVPGDDCAWWTGSISGAGHGRFWVGSGKVMVAHRFGFALAAGLAALEAAPVVAHRCDNPLCQRVHPDHLAASTPGRNRREWVIRRAIAGGPLTDPRGARGRALALRDLVRRDPSAVILDRVGVLARTGEQLRLFD